MTVSRYIYVQRITRANSRAIDVLGDVWERLSNLLVNAALISIVYGQICCTKS